MAFPGMLSKSFNQCCKCCKNCSNDFKKVLDLKKSGLAVYIHHRCKDMKPSFEDKYDAIVLFNNTDKHLKGCSFLSELGQHRVTCLKCKNIIDKVRYLLAEIKCIKGNQTIGICDYCKRENISNCKRCEYIVSKFMTSNDDAAQAMIQYLISWVRKVMISLQFRVEGGISKHNLNVRDNCVEELQRLLNELESPLTIRQPNLLKTMMNKVLTSLQTILEGFLENYKFKARDASAGELQSLLSDFNKLLINAPFMRQPNIERFPIVEEIKSLHKLKIMELLETLMSNFSNESETSSTASYSTITNIMTKKENITEKKKLGKPSPLSKGSKKIDKENLPTHTPKNEINVGKSIINRKDKISKDREKNNYNTNIGNATLLKTKNKKGASNDKVATKDTQKEAKKDKGINKKDTEKKEGIKKNGFKEIVMKKNMQKEYEKVQAQPNQVPPLVEGIIESTDGSSSKVIECANTRVVPNVMIRKQHIIPFNPHYGKQNGSSSPVQYQVLNSISGTLINIKPKRQGIESIGSYKGVDEGAQEIRRNAFARKGVCDVRHITQEEQGIKVPLLFHVTKNISSHSVSNLPILEDSITSEPLSTVTPKKILTETNNKGVITYQLSNPEFITKGWTQLPSLRIMRRINLYRMEPAVNNWFERNKDRIVLYNGSDDKLADVDEFGFGKLFYKNGRVALDYYKATETNAKYRYVVYSDGEPKNGVPTPVTILGVFDGTGCGVVYDNYGRDRLKYNQFEGMIIDKSIDSPCRWKWHSLNDPPVLQPVFSETIRKNVQIPVSCKPVDLENESVYSNKNDEMLKIEFENFLKEKANKLLKKFKPLEIKSKSLKLNQQFSLHVFHQTVINLVFRDGRTSIKLNLGTMLISNEILGTESHDAAGLFTTYDRFPPRSDSVEDIQKLLDAARKIKKKIVA